MKKAIAMMIVFSSMLFACYNNAADMSNEYSLDYEQTAQIAAVDTYTVKMRLKVPRIYNNTQSLGSRKYQSQLVVGKMQLMYTKDGRLADVRFMQFVNKTHKMSNGKNVIYNTDLAENFYPRFNAIGSNKTGKFKTASVCFSIAAEPSYNIGEMNEDNGLYLVLSGKGKLSSYKLKSMSGYASGTIGCGCMAYGHKSPTRRIGYYGATDEVDDVAAVYGTWTARLDN